MHEVDCDANAQAVLTDSELAALTRESTDPATILDTITSTLGLDWQTPAAVLPAAQPHSPPERR